MNLLAPVMRIILNMEAKVIFKAQARKKNLMRLNKLARGMMVDFVFLSDGVPVVESSLIARVLVVPVSFAMFGSGLTDNSTFTRLARKL